MLFGQYRETSKKREGSTVQAMLDLLHGDITVADVMAMAETETPESEAMSDDDLTAYAIRLWELSMQCRENS